MGEKWAKINIFFSVLCIKSILVGCCKNILDNFLGIKRFITTIQQVKLEVVLQKLSWIKNLFPRVW